jgi:phage tail-like protein
VNSFADLGNLGGLNSPADKKKGLTTQFKIVVPDLRDMVFHSCEGLEAEVEVISFSEGGSLDAPRTGRGRARVNLISFGQGTTADKAGRTIFDWFKDVRDASKSLDKKTLSISLNTIEGKSLAEWHVHNAWPCRWKAPIMSDDSTQTGVEYLTFAHEGIERKR